MTPADRNTRDRHAEASEWAFRRREGLNRAEQSDLKTWLGEDARHTRALEQSDRVWDDLAEIDLRGLDARLGGGRLRTLRLAMPGWAAMAAALLVAVLAGIGLYVPGGRAYATEHGEVRTVHLGDGSSIILGAKSKIVVRLDRDSRQVDLRRGEAVFEVAPDAARPFRVSAADTQVTVLGTRFVVKAAPDRVRVDVIKGVVRVAKTESPLVTPFIRNEAVGERIVRGERMESPRGADLHRITSVDPVDAAPWMQGRLVYENASLAEVVDDLNRYAPVRVKLASAELGALRVNAALRRDQASTFLDTLPATLPVKIDRHADGRITIRAAG